MEKITVRIFSIVLLGVSFNSCEKTIIQPKESEEEIHRFKIEVNTAFDNHPIQMESDWCVLIMPKTNNSKPKLLVIYCHSGGGRTTDHSSEAENVDIVHYLVSKGYAVLDVCGMPETYASRVKVDNGRTVGSYISLRATLEAYNYVLKNFNINSNGCFIFSNSNGGLLASNVVNLTKIPIFAQSGLAPLISIEKNTWMVPSGPIYMAGFTSFQNRANIIRIFGMKNITNQTELINAQYEKEKVGIYDPFDYCINQSNKSYRAPYLIFTFKGDTSVFYDIAEEFSKKMNSRGSKIIISDIVEYGGHNIPAKPIIVGSYTYMGKTENLKLTVKTIGDFFDSYNPDLK